MRSCYERPITETVTSVKYRSHVLSLPPSVRTEIVRSPWELCKLRVETQALKRAPSDDELYLEFPSPKQRTTPDPLPRPEVMPQQSFKLSQDCPNYVAVVSRLRET